MQIKKKENPVMIKNINIENAHNKPSNNYKPDIIPDKLSRPSKKTLTIEERTNNYEDRAQPYEMARSKSRKSMSAVNNKAAMPESWFCETCKKINKPYEYKCQGKLIFIQTAERLTQLNEKFLKLLLPPALITDPNLHFK